MKKIAYLFPGQGAQYVGMGKDFFDHFAVSRETFQEADEALGFHLSRIAFEGPENTLIETQHSQLAIFVCSMAILRAAEQQLPELKPAVCAGLSLGEYTALCASKRLGFVETLLLIRERARLMNDACEKQAGTMAAVLGLNGPEVEAAVKGVPGVWVANYNCPGQIVISGTRTGVDQGTEALKARGAKRVIPLSVHGAFHSGLMQSAQDGLAPFIAAAPIQESAIGFVMNATGMFALSVEEVKRLLVAQVTSSVRWQQGIEAMGTCGYYIEIGCGKTLSGMNRKIGVAGSMISIEKIADLDRAASEVMQCNC